MKVHIVLDVDDVPYDDVALLEWALWQLETYLPDSPFDSIDVADLEVDPSAIRCRKIKVWGEGG